MNELNLNLETKILFIAVNYNGFLYTEKYIKSILELKGYSRHNVSILIVDNNSKYDDICELKNMSRLVDGVNILYRDVNDGYFSGLNYGILSAKIDDYDYVFVGNNDLELDPSFLINLEGISFDSNVHALCPDVVTLDGRHQNPHVITRVGRYEKFKSDVYFSNYYLGQLARIVFKIVKFFPNILYAKKANNYVEYPRMVIKRGIGACYLLTKNFFENNSILSNKVFLWGEEVLLSHQIESSNGVLLYTPELKVLHAESASVKLIANRKRYEMVKTSYSIYRKYF